LTKTNKEKKSDDNKKSYDHIVIMFHFNPPINREEKKRLKEPSPLPGHR
jgi:hypothetical protein